MLVKSGPGLKTNSRALGLPHRDAQHVGGQHVGGELDALERGPDGPGQARGQRGLAHAGHVLDQEVPAGDQADDGEPHHLRLSEQRAPDVFLETADGFRRVAHRIPLYRTAHFSTRAGRWPGLIPSATLSGAMAFDPPQRAPLAPQRPRGLRLHVRPRRGDAVDGPRRARAGHPLAGAIRAGGSAAAHPGAPAHAGYSRLVLHPGLGGRAPPGRGARHRGRRPRDRLPR